MLQNHRIHPISALNTSKYLAVDRTGVTEHIEAVIHDQQSAAAAAPGSELSGEIRGNLGVVGVAVAVVVC